LNCTVKIGIKDIYLQSTLESGIDVAPGTNVAPSQITDNLNLLYRAKGKKRKKQIQKSINVAPFNKEIAPGKPPEN